VAGNAVTASPYGALVVSADRDLHVANAAVPSYFYKVFSANISCALASLSTGYNNYKLTHSTSGNTNYVGFVKDNLNSAPTLVTANVIMVEATAGTYRYISGVPYYNTGSPTVTIANLEVQNLAGQTFTSTNPFILNTGTVVEGSGGVVAASQTKSLAGIDNAANSMLTGSNVKANVGIGLLKKYASKNKINLRKELEDIIQNHPEISKRFSGAEPLETPKGWGLPLGSKRRKISGERFMLLGDAGSLIDPFTGEGIANAMICSMHAANVIELALEKKEYSSHFLSEYDKRVYNRLGKEFSISTTLQKLSRFPWLFNFVVKKAIKNKTFRETLTAMFNDLDLRSSFKDPKFYWRILKN
jgi:hypothetical protein